jgi:Ribonuclease G/E
LMKYDIDEKYLYNLKDKLDALIEKGLKLSKDLSVEEQYNLIKKIILEAIDKALQNIAKDGETELSEKEIMGIKEELEHFVQEYSDKKFSEIIALNWEMKQK